jgi:hypothetical protein
VTLSRINHLGAAPTTGLATGINNTATSLTLNSGTGYPTANFVIKLDAGTAAEEKVLVGTRSGTTCSSLTRGYDGTSATSHSSGTANVEHDLAAVVIDDANDHVYTTTRDDHTQYARTDGTRAFTGTVTVSSGGLTVSGGGAAVTGNSTVTGTLNVTSNETVGGTLGVTGAATLSSTLGVTGAITGSSTVQGTAHIATLTGTNGRYVGQTNGAPVSGTFNTGDFANDPTNGVIWQCTAGGTPGTWQQLGGATDAAWTAATLINSWANNTTNDESFACFPAGYRKQNGRVYLRGNVNAGGSSSSSMMTLPAGYRPSKALDFTINATGGFGVITVNSDGNVYLSHATSGATSVSLDNISFDTLS